MSHWYQKITKTKFGTIQVKNLFRVYLDNLGYCSIHFWCDFHYMVDLHFEILLPLSFPIFECLPHMICYSFQFLTNLTIGNQLENMIIKNF